MSMSVEEINKCLQKFEIAACDNNVAEMEKLLSIGELKQNIYTYGLLYKAARSGHAVAFHCLIKLNLVHGHSVHTLRAALQVAIDNNHLEVVKLLIPIYEQHSQGKLLESMLPTELTESNLEIIKFLLTVPTFKKTFGTTNVGEFFYALLENAILRDSLEIIESLLEVDMAGICLHAFTKLENYRKKSTPSNGIQLSAERQSLAIVFCLADKIKSTPEQEIKHYWEQHYQCYKQNFVRNFEKTIVQIKGQSTSIDNFLQNYEQDILLKLSPPLAQLKNLLPPPLTELVMQYLDRIENYPSKLLRKATACLSSVTSVSCPWPPIPTMILSTATSSTEKKTIPPNHRPSR